MLEIQPSNGFFLISLKKANMNKKEETLPTNIQWVPNFKLISQRFSELVIAIGCLVLLGWMQDIEALKSIVPGLASMKSMTAMLFVLSGVSLWLYARRLVRFIAQACAFLVLLGGLLTLGEYLFNINFGIDQLLFQDNGAGVLHPGRMSPATALAFLLISLALIFLDNLSRNWFNESLVILTFVISALALIGYIYGVSSLYQIAAYSSMALHTALCFALLSLGIFFARPEAGIMQIILADTAGGQVLRRLLPVTLVLPVFLGWIRLWGQSAGLYDTAFGVALMAISLITTMTILIWINARQLTDIDIKRKHVDDSLHASELRFRSTLESMIEGCQILGHDWRYLFINASAERHNRRPSSELMGKIYMEMWPGIEATAVFSVLRQCMNERTLQYMENEFIFPDGSSGWFELSIQPVPDGIFILSSDITGRKQAEQALLEREMKLTKLFEILPVGISILDEQRQVSYTNPALKKILDVSEEGLLKDTYRNRKYLRADGTSMPVDELASVRAFKEQREINGVETGVIKEDDSIVWTNASAVPVDFPDWKVVMVTSDITERKQAEERFRLAIESAPNAVIMMDQHGQIVLVNSQAEKYFGYERTELMTKNLDILVPVRFRGDHANHRAGFFSQPQDRAMGAGRDLYGLRKDGSEFPVEIGLAPINTQEGMLVLATIVDITERKKREEETRKLEERFSTAFRASPAGLTITTLADGKFVDANGSYLEMLGYRREEVIGHTAVELNMLSAEERAKPVQQLRKQGRIRNFELQLRSKSGQLVDTLFSSEQIELNGVACILTILIDNTERKQAEEALHANERRLHLAAAAGEVGIWDWDVVKDELIWDESMYFLYGIQKKDFSGAYHAWISTLHPDDRQFTEGEIQAALRGEREYAPEFRIVRPDGVIRVIKATSQTIHDQDGKALRMIGTNIDITERKQAEEEILKLNADLEGKVASRTAELATANEQLHQLSIIDELTGLYNRRGFHLLAEEQFLLAKRSGYNLLIFYADLDGLKQVNDQQGHIAGDQAIITAAQALNQTFRASDIKARLGGDEFIVLAIDCIETDAPTLLVRLQERLTKQGLAMSVGVVALDSQRDLSMADLITRADEAMYEVKLSKRIRRREAD
jgi:diguanylate cyclase (GGDEF)-like protein/PAS domain S-box-containing protein